MKLEQIKPREVLKTLGCVRRNRTADAIEVETRLGALWLLCPNSDDDIRKGVHVDEITVPEKLRKKGVATEALMALCALADKYRFELKGGPVGWSEEPWGQKFVAWLGRHGLEPDHGSGQLPVDDPTAHYVRRLPRQDKRLRTSPRAF